MTTVPREYKAIEQDEGKRKAGETPWEYYLKRSLEIANLYLSPVILKTDAYNEAHEIPKLGGIAGNLPGTKIIIEYKAAEVELAKQKCPDCTVICGDIRNLPFADNFFDILIDPSTLDHIHPRDLLKTLDGYKRVLRSGGSLALFVWVTNNEKYKAEYASWNTWGPDQQYYHPESEMDSLINSRFKLIERDHFWSVSDIHMDFYYALKG